MILHTYDFNQLTDDLISQADTYTFNLRNLPPVNNYQTNIRADLNFVNIFTALDSKLTNCLYWFELDSNKECENLINILNSKREELAQQGRSVPVKNNNTGSNVLYLGVRRGGLRKKDNLSNISGRISIHFGYYKVGTTQGLQLAHWAIDSGLDIKLKVIQFEEGFPNAYLEAFEKIMAHKLKPLCGKH